MESTTSSSQSETSQQKPEAFPATGTWRCTKCGHPVAIDGLWRWDGGRGCWQHEHPFGDGGWIYFDAELRA